MFDVCVWGLAIIRKIKPTSRMTVDDINVPQVAQKKK